MNETEKLLTAIYQSLENLHTTVRNLAIVVALILAIALVSFGFQVFSVIQSLK